jgi:3-phenylpropionate/trans-cinnamate dioxygenase ferredoxin subunit
MSEWTRIARLEDFPISTRRVLDVDGTGVVVFHLEDGFHAVEDACTHDGGELASGRLEGREIVCPRHGAHFDVTTGAVTAPPAFEPVAVLPTRVEAGWVEVRDDRWE